MLAELCLEPECRRGHGGLYDALNCGEVRVARLRRALSGLPLPAWPDGRIRLAVDVSNWLRPDAATSPDRSFCHCYGRGKSSAQMIPGWPYSLVAALERGRTSWTLPLDAVRLRPDDDLAAVTAAQVRDVVTRLAAAGHWKDGDPDIMVIFDAGYEPARLAWLLRDLPVQVTGRLGTNRVFRLPPPPRRPGQMGAAGEARRGAAARRGRRPAGTGRRHHHRDQPVRGRGRPVMEPGAPEAEGPRRMGRPPGGNSRSSRALSSGSPSITCPMTARRSPCGCGPPGRTRAPPGRTCAGRRSCAALISNTRSGSSSRPWAGPARNSAIRPPPIAGPGSSWPPSPSSGSPAAWPPMSGFPGSSPAFPAG